MLADIVLVVHGAFVIFVVLGGLLVLRWRWVAWLHIPALIWGVLIEFIGYVCPLTPLEASLRTQAEERTYEGGFVEHYVTALLYPAGLTRTVQVVLAIGLAISNVAIYGYLLRKHKCASEL